MARAKPDPSADDRKSRVLDAAIGCILDLGYYRASSNEIARRAGVSWGIIQHYFGTRERLMLAVLERDFDRLVSLLVSAETSAPTLRERLAALQGVVDSYYGKPSYMATLQIRLNLTHDPDTTRATAEAQARHGRALRRGWLALARKALDPHAVDDRLSWHVFNVLRSISTGSAVSRALTPAQLSAPGWIADEDPRYRELALEMVHDLIVNRFPPVSPSTAGEGSTEPRAPAAG